MSDYPTESSDFAVQVVGAAIVDSLDGPRQILVARRSAPEALAGLWAVSYTHLTLPTKRIV